MADLAGAPTSKVSLNQRAVGTRRITMKDYQAHHEKLQKDAAECALVPDLATDAKREMFDRLSRHLNQLADEVERAMSAPKAT
jgi:hypothetical protein